MYLADKLPNGYLIQPSLPRLVLDYSPRVGTAKSRHNRILTSLDYRVDYLFSPQVLHFSSFYIFTLM